MFVFNILDIIWVALLLFFVVALAFGQLMDLVRQMRCKHPRFYENRACHAICAKCRKDLGFVKHSRDNPDREEV